MRRPIRRVVIVGGGTAGWLAAIHLSRFWKPRQPGAAPLDITLIESPQMPIIGVGEATTGLFTTFVRDFADEREFLRETKGSFKLGIMHRGWRDPDSFYLGPLNDTRTLGIESVPPETFPYYHALSVAEGEPAWKDILNSPLMLANKSPYSRAPGKKPVTAWDYAYHFDTHHVGAFLAKRTRGVIHVSATVKGVTQEPGTGNVKSVVLDDGREIEGDFFIDASGFRRLIIGGVFKEPWISWADALPMNHALPFSIPVEEGQPLISYTHAWAMSSGWMWQIPTQERLGCGYVYCDAFIDGERAQAEAEARLGHPIEPWGDIKFTPGRFRRLWVKNCVAVGLSAAFVEPLESTSIHGQLMQLLTLVREYLVEHFDFDAEAVLDSYNERMGRMYDDFRDFLVMHYQGGRSDTEFWRSVTVSDEVRKLRDLWRATVPLTTHVTAHGTINLFLWLYTIDGVGTLDREVARQQMDHYGLWEPARRARAEQRRRIDDFTRHAIDHATYLKEVREGLEPGELAGAAAGPKSVRGGPAPAPGRAARRARQQAPKGGRRGPR